MMTFEDLNNPNAAVGLSRYSERRFGIYCLSLESYQSTRNFSRVNRALFEARGTIHHGFKYVAFEVDLVHHYEPFDLTKFARCAMNGFKSDQVMDIWGYTFNRSSGQWERRRG
jgi:hypothetical protein